MAGSMAVTCSKCFPECAYTLGAGLDATNLPLWLTHIKEKHTHAELPPEVTLFNSLTLS